MAYSFCQHRVESTGMQNVPCLTPGGVLRLQKRIEAAREDYFRVVASNEEAAGAGDNCVTHDNFAWEENQRQMHQLAWRVRELTALLQSSSVCELPTETPKVARVGTKITLEFLDGSIEEWVIAGFDDGDPALHRVAYNAPLGRALVGHGEGDEVRIGVGPKSRDAEILGISAVTAKEDRADDWGPHPPQSSRTPPASKT